MLRAPNECYEHQRRRPDKETLVTVGVILPAASINQISSYQIIIVNASS